MTAGNRLRLFMKHHTRLPGPIRVTSEEIISKSTFAPHNVLELYRARVEHMTKLESMNLICTAQTCSKCAKYVAKYVAFNHCTIILNTPQCCPTRHILLTGF